MVEYRHDVSGTPSPIVADLVLAGNLCYRKLHAQRLNRNATLKFARNSFS